MLTTTQRWPTFAILTAGLLLAVATAGADDRQLLRTDGAPPNVVVILDAGIAMTHDVATGTLRLPASGDDEGGGVTTLVARYGMEELRSAFRSAGRPAGDAEILAALGSGAKLTQAKHVLRELIDGGLDVNLGFTFTEHRGLEVSHLDYLYEVAEADAAGRPQRMLDGTGPGTLLRLGAAGTVHDSGDAGSPAPFYPVRFGADGTESFFVVGRDGGPWTPVPRPPADGRSGEAYIESYLVGPGGVRKIAAALPPYYYPAYDWRSLSPPLRQGFEGARSWLEVAAALGRPYSDARGARAFRDWVLSQLDHAQMGSRELRLREDLYAWDAAVGAFVSRSSRTTDLRWRQVFVLADHEPSEEGAGPRSVTAVRLPEAEACSGYEPSNPGENEPAVPLVRPDAGPGEVAWSRQRVAELLAPQADAHRGPVFYFPTREPAASLPAARASWLPGTDAIVAGGRRPLTAMLDRLASYFTEVAAWDDPFADCRRDVVVLITDGGETCAEPEGACVAAAGLGRRRPPVRVYPVLFGAAREQETRARPTMECIAAATGGAVFSARDEAELRQALVTIAGDIDAGAGAYAPPLIPAATPGGGRISYVGSFTPVPGRSVWRGHMRAYAAAAEAPFGEGAGPAAAGALWDAGDTLAALPAGARHVFFGLSSGDGGGGVAQQPGARVELGLGLADGSGAAGALLAELVLGEAVDDEHERARLESAIAFTLGQAAGYDGETGRPLAGRGTAYDWCGFTDVAPAGGVSGAPAPCGDGRTVLGTEKLGDIFHSAPQLLAGPSCYPCWLRDLHGYRGNSGSAGGEGFAGRYRHRRRVVLVGADDGTLHAFDAGLWDADSAGYDSGTGRELFAWLPRGVMGTLDDLAGGTQHHWTVDGTPTVADVVIDRGPVGAGASEQREWRTVVLFGERRGGRSYVCLDLTDPDGSAPPAGDRGIATMDSAGRLALATLEPDPRAPRCLDGRGPGCPRPWPAFRWEVRDDSDEDGNGRADMGQTWSRPLVSFVRVEVDGRIETRSLAFVGGGLGSDGLSTSPAAGNFVYGLDVETGRILFKAPTAGMVPGDLAGLDLDLDGFVETLYWGDTSGRLYRMELPQPVPVDGSTGRIRAWAPQVLFDAGDDGGGGRVERPFFVRPSLAVAASAGGPTVVLAIGTGNRDDLLAPSAAANRFYLLADRPPAGGRPLTEADLAPPVPADGAPAVTPSLLDVYPGWYLVFEGTTAAGPPPAEKVTAPAMILDNQVVFSTFTPGPAPGTGGDAPGRARCGRAGRARTYRVRLANGDPPEDTEAGRYVEHEPGAVVAGESVVFAGADGKIHGVMILDDLELEEPVAAADVAVKVESWKEE